LDKSAASKENTKKKKNLVSRISESSLDDVVPHVPVSFYYNPVGDCALKVQGSLSQMSQEFDLVKGKRLYSWEDGSCWLCSQHFQEAKVDTKKADTELGEDDVEEDGGFESEDQEPEQTTKNSKSKGKNSKTSTKGKGKGKGQGALKQKAQSKVHLEHPTLGSKQKGELVTKVTKCNPRHLLHSKAYHQGLKSALAKGVSPEKAKIFARTAAAKAVKAHFGV
jgi:hypothetical protein